MMFDQRHLAEAIATAAHAGQTDKAGMPYIEHPARVVRHLSRNTNDFNLIAAAWLHDVLEDTAVTRADLRRVGVSPATIAVVELLTHPAREPYTDAIARCATDFGATLCKRADLADNTDPARLALLPEETQQRLLAKYQPAIETLDAVLAKAGVTFTPAPSEAPAG